MEKICKMTLGKAEIKIDTFVLHCSVSIREIPQNSTLFSVEGLYFQQGACISAVTIYSDR
jgi:hypothetical protein